MTTDDGATYLRVWDETGTSCAFLATGEPRLNAAVQRWGDDD